MDKSKVAKGILNALNDFRANPVNVRSSLNNFIVGMQQLSPRTKALGEYKEFSKKLDQIESFNQLKFSEELAKAAKKYLQKIIPTGIEHDFKEGKDLKEIIPPQFYSKNCALVMHTSLDEEHPESVVVNITNNVQDETKLGYRCLASPNISQVGIVEEKTKDDSYFAFIFAEDSNGYDFEIPGVDLSELRQAFDLLDIEEIHKIKIKDVLSQFEAEGRDETCPAIYEMLKGLDKGKEYVNWKEFATFCHGKMSDAKSDNGRQRIFDIFLPDKDYRSIDYSQLNHIRSYLELNYSDEEIKKMLQNTTNSQMGIDYNDFTERIKDAKETSYTDFNQSASGKKGKKPAKLEIETED